jgi:hypothetical protein
LSQVAKFGLINTGTLARCVPITKSRRSIDAFFTPAKAPVLMNGSQRHHKISDVECGAGAAE